jgi:hypothetical protein
LRYPPGAKEKGLGRQSCISSTSILINFVHENQATQSQKKMARTQTPMHQAGIIDMEQIRQHETI